MEDTIARYQAEMEDLQKSRKEIIKKVPLDFLTKAYMGLHDLELDLAVKKVGGAP